jgi:hypothetical protein
MVFEIYRDREVAGVTSENDILLEMCQQKTAQSFGKEHLQCKTTVFQNSLQSLLFSVFTHFFFAWVCMLLDFK